MDGDAGARCMDLVRRSMQGQRAEHEGPKADAAERPTQESQGLLFVEHGGTLQREDRRGGTRNVNRKAEANAKTQRLMGERPWGGVVRSKACEARISCVREQTGGGVSASCDNACCHRVSRRKQFAATGVAAEGDATGDWCHAEAAAWIDVIGCCDDRSAGAEPSVCRCGPRRDRKS